MYHIDDLPFNTGSLPDVYTQFRKVKAIIVFIGRGRILLGTIRVQLEIQ